MKITLPLPPTTNHYKIPLKRGGMVLTSEARVWKEEAQWRMRTLHPKMIEGMVEVQVTFFLKYDRDVDNLKMLLDVMSGIVYKDDKQVVDLYIQKRVDKVNPRVEVCVSEM